MNTDVMFSKASDEWVTPQDLYDRLNLEFRFQWDAAATDGNSKCGGYAYFGPDHIDSSYRDALSPSNCWHTNTRKRFWLNPPYSKCRQFIERAALEAVNGAFVVALVPARTDTRWFHDYVWDDVKHFPRPFVSVRFLKGRLKFAAAGQQAKNSAPFPSMIVVFHPQQGRD